VQHAAREMFLSRGYAATTIAAVAAKAGVSPETIYKSFGGKPGLVRAIADQALGGAGPVHAEVRSDRLQVAERDPRKIIRGWGKLMMEVSPRISPILLLVRTAAATDPEMRDLAKTISEERLRRMTRNARTLVDGGHARKGITLEHAAELLWTYTAPGLYELLVLDRGWSVERYARFVVDALIAALL
jgi:AcrR family transcriptional regulator